ncbi:Astacin-like metalloendopeptidase [Strongyloides ratti]|uniref:Metalloendopeptidase n=1 Tax=Strongyloides ratti TaxID=34506 RepID=A0A090KQT4_STRRB|nr:Astacin-like metalloendopeptidase [Strongyloides ratti]CEF59714.1 Astacin-like metalloendopeptidase [Strongyloides ratti]
MKKTIYIYIFSIIIFILIIYFWCIYKSSIYNHNQIIVSSDIIFNDIHIDHKRDLFRDIWNPWISPINYCVGPSVSSKNVKIAIEEVINHTCIKFNKINETTNKTQELLFKKSQRCLSYIGHIESNHTQIIELTPNCYDNPYVILHEIGHALGLVHEHARTDRDEYIKINTGNMKSDRLSNLEILKTPAYFNYSTYYDYAALMHYSQFAFATFWSSFFGWPVIESKLEREYSWMIGQRKKMTFNEFKQINLFYCNWCNWIDNKTGLLIKNNDYQTLCKNGGYPDYKNCSKCICPTGYTGDLCDYIIKSDTECGKTNFDVNTTETSIVLNDKMTCYFSLKAKNSKKVLLKVTYVNAPYKESICTEDTGYQVKYRKDKGATGLLLCGHHSRLIILKSESNDILLFYRGESGHSFMHFTFKEVD